MPKHAEALIPRYQVQSAKTKDHSLHNRRPPHSSGTELVHGPEKQQAQKKRKDPIRSHLLCQGPRPTSPYRNPARFPEKGKHGPSRHSSASPLRPENLLPLPCPLRQSWAWTLGKATRNTHVIPKNRQERKKEGNEMRSQNTGLRWLAGPGVAELRAGGEVFDCSLGSSSSYMPIPKALRRKRIHKEESSLQRAQWETRNTTPIHDSRNGVVAGEKLYATGIMADDGADVSAQLSLPYKVFWAETRFWYCFAVPAVMYRFPSEHLGR